ncbi:hypothetical protein DEU56DRAFT_89430 [Suillus clintonianus]|uniref:uncharacterized protein n=1 Tax=Suillus clintonianus TaxID=1904413 RepID=UPI001B8847E7|nr:uncharacterized protein DEU56DRAFT_89430 [Suillus clintonianus]KAG2121924.1 hypothetical protein DEU56DRAFT_89430 [Suillus clintonianus]
MRISSIFLAPIFAVAALAQNVYIAAPVPNQTVSAGSNFTVDIVRPDFQSSTQEVAVVIAIQSCNPTCWPGEALGDILYNGPYSPQVPKPNPGNLQPYQNFTVQVPSYLMGNALLTVTHVALIGAGPIAWMEEKNVTVYVL